MVNMVKAQWLGGPGDMTWVEIPEGMTALIIAEGPSLDMKKFLEAEDMVGETVNIRKYSVPIRKMTIEDDQGNIKTKLVLDYYAKA